MFETEYFLILIHQGGTIIRCCADIIGSYLGHLYQDIFVDKESIQKKFLLFTLRRTLRRDEKHKV